MVDPKSRRLLSASPMVWFSRSRFVSNRFVSLYSIAAWLPLIALTFVGSSLQAADAVVDFDRDVAALLSTRCLECHHGDEPKGNLDLARQASVAQGGDSGPSLVAGDPDASPLWQRVAADEMPPKQPLSADEKEILRRWIASGARWGSDPIDPFRYSGRNRAGYDWWSLQPVRRPRVPDTSATSPASESPAAESPAPVPSSAVDAFLGNRLAERGLQAAPPATELAWLRRAYFAIIGLPPTIEQVAEFQRMPLEGRRERVVDQLLASPHYGERWARHWMDLMRYAESRGHESDYLIANAWHYRDYLVRALNEDIAYDQFLREHLAGDLLPRPRTNPSTQANESVLATGWAFLGEEVHSPVDIRQDECDRVDNKVDVFTKTFLGMTVACARCHDHKFDPIRARDYYAMVGYVLSSSYRQVRFEAMENNRAMARELAAVRVASRGPLLAGIASSGDRAWEQLPDYLSVALAGLSRQDLDTAVVERLASEEGRSLEPARLQAWIDHLRQATADASHPLHRLALAAQANDLGQLAPVVNDASDGAPTAARVIADYRDASASPWLVDGEAFGPAPQRPGDVIFGGVGEDPVLGIATYGAARSDRFWRGLRNAPDNENDSGRLNAAQRAGRTLRTPTFTLNSGRLHYLVRGRSLVYAAVNSHLMIEGPLHQQLMLHFDTGAATTPQWVTHDLTPYAGHRVHVEFGQEGQADLEVLQVVEADAPPAVRFTHDRWLAGSPLRTWRDAAVRFHEGLHAARRQMLGSTRALPDAPADPDANAFADWIVRNRWAFGVDRPETRAAGEQSSTAAFQAAMHDLAARTRWESRTAVAWLDGNGVDSPVLLRGKPTRPGDTAVRSLPVALVRTLGPADPVPATASSANLGSALDETSAIPAAPADSSGRLQLAEQLTDPRNPLVPRVVVNRIWHHLFGRGLVSTVDNFGALGERPSHPELLDYLAAQFVSGDGRSMKRLIRRLVLTDAFARTSDRTDARAEELDPANILLHRMPVRRLEAEVIRDALLAVSGRLDRQVGGRPVPVHLTEFVVGRGAPEIDGPLDGAGRRSLYTAVRRNFLPTMMLAFDMPTPFSAIGRRNVTNVPAQSLVLMNDPLFQQEAARWAGRLEQACRGASERERVEWLFRTAFAREADTAEVDACLATLAELRADPSTAGQPEDAWSQLCHALLSTNEFIYLR
jgi:hypothetical protein